MYSPLKSHLKEEISKIHSEGLLKTEHALGSAQGAWIHFSDGSKLLNLCSNNYLGLANHPEMISAAKRALDEWGYGMASVRFICGTQSIHKQLERRISKFLGMEDALLYSSCFDANTGLFETILGEKDAIISDALNHASIIDGVRLCKAKRFRYANNNLVDLESKLIEAKDARFRWIVTDGVFSMDGSIADLNGICDLAEVYQAIVMVDDSHAVGFIGKQGRGTHEYCKAMGRVVIITGTLGKALGGASGGYTASKMELIEILRQRSRPYLFSNSLAPMIVHNALCALDLIEKSEATRKELMENTRFLRKELQGMGYKIPDGIHPIIPVLVGDAKKTQNLAERLLKEGIYVTPFSYPVVPRDQARIRLQLSADHKRSDLEFAQSIFRKLKNRLSDL
jgi:glycine C-acetyltransferase